MNLCSSMPSKLCEVTTECDAVHILYQSIPQYTILHQARMTLLSNKETHGRQQHAVNSTQLAIPFTVYTMNSASAHVRATAELLEKSAAQARRG